MTKKIFAMFLAVLMVVSMLPTSVFAASNACDVCELVHTTKCPECGGTSYTLVKTVEATCNHEGGYVVKCTACSEEYFIEETKKLDDHTWVDVAEQAPGTCKEADGVIAHRECSGCGLKQFQKNGKWVEMTDANKDEWTIKSAGTQSHKWTNPTDVVCGDEDGKFTAVCSVCGAEKEHTVYAAHSWKQTGSITAATATKNGKATVYCEGCMTTKTITVYFEHDHNIVLAEAKAPTCTETGYVSYYYCTVCNQKYSTNEVDEVEGETLADYEISDELFNKIHKNENDLEENELNGYTLEKVSHVYPATTTCQDTTAVCVNCHVRYDIKNTDNAGWTMDGHKKYDVDGKTLIPVPFTDCKDSVTCVVCEKNLTVHDILTEEETENTALAHKWQTTQQYKCVEGTAKCTTCGATKTVEAGNHNINGTCNNSANTCKYCGKTVKELGLNHTYDPEKAVTVKATCTTNSETKNQCIYCENVNIVYGDDRLGHILQTVVIPATCQSKSKTVVYCTREDCTEEIDTELTAAYPEQIWSGLKYELTTGNEKVWVVLFRNNNSNLGFDTAVEWIAAANETALKNELKTKIASGAYGEYIGYASEVYPEAVDGGFALSVIINGEKLYVACEYDEENWSYNLTLSKEPATLTLTEYNGSNYITYTYVDEEYDYEEPIYLSKTKTSIGFTATPNRLPKGDAIAWTLVDGGLHLVKTEEGNSDKNAHVWQLDKEYSEYEGAATCTQDEVQKWDCKYCSEVKYVPVEGSKKDHKDPDGNSAIYVLVGSADEADWKNTWYDYSAVSELNGDVQKDATCAEKGYYYTYCTECGETVKKEIAKDSTNHVWGSDYKDAVDSLDHNKQSVTGVWTCTNEKCATRVYKIEWDGAKEIYENRAEAEKVHGTLAEGDKIQEGNCAQLEIYKVTCSCGDTVKYYNDTDKDGNKYGEHNYAGYWAYNNETYEFVWVVYDESNYFVAATCQSPSKTYSYGCLRDGCSEKHYAYDKDGTRAEIGNYVLGEKVADHDWKLNPNYVEPSHDNPVYEGDANFVYKYQCSVCDEVKSDGTVKLVEKTPSTCTKYGYEMYLCWCGDIHIREYQAKLGHNYVVDTSKEIVLPTCTKVGSHYVICTECGDKKSGKTVTDAKIAHVNADGEEFWDSCQDEVTDRHCVNCCEHKNKKNEDGTDHVCDEKCACVIATNHNFEAKIQKPTCTEKGYTYWQCACGEKMVENGELVKSLETDAIGHVVNEVEAKNIKADYYGYTYVLLSNGKYGEYKEYTAPTYETEGSCKFTCTKCKNDVEVTLDKLNGLGLTLDADEYTYGSLVSVKIDLVNVADKISGGELTLNFGSNLTYVDVADSLDATFYTSGVVENGALKLQFVSLSGDVDVSEITYLTTVYFRYLPENEVNGEDAIVISASGAKYDTKNADEEDVSKDLTATGIAKADVRVFGDFNADGKFDRLDLYAALKMFELDAEKTYDVTMDANYDGVVDVADIQTMLGILTGEIDINDNVREFMSKDEIKAHFGTYCEKCEKWYTDGCDKHEK